MSTGHRRPLKFLRIPSPVLPVLSEAEGSLPALSIVEVSKGRNTTYELFLQHSGLSVINTPIIYAILAFVAEVVSAK